MNAPFRNTAILDHAVRPLRQYLDDDGVTEVVINEPTIVGVERHGGWTWEREAGLTLDALNELARAAAAFTSQDVTRENPICSTIFPTGERVQLVLPPVVPDGTVSITVRKPSTKTMTMADFEASGLFSETKVATKRVSPVEEKLLGLLHAGRHIEFFELAPVHCRDTDSR
ncbi:hypothetical protein [Sphingomonas sp. ABOLD]|uniref:hypothetical protein n=1 Tax=Sphingomonas sp. ABOLD TaxID=1985877 RepID=UPI001F49702F|nr:hypothetical protein [Sphingomonas sp. ABOLD]